MSKNSNKGAAQNVNAPKAPRVKKQKGRPLAGALTLKTDGAVDALKGRVACRTSVIHAILVDLYNKGAEDTLNTKRITDLVNAQWARAIEGRPTTNAATASHLNTMKGRGYIEHGADGRGWRLSAAGAKILSGAQ